MKDLDTFIAEVSAVLENKVIIKYIGHSEIWAFFFICVC